MALTTLCLLLLSSSALIVAGYLVTDDEIRRVLESLGSEDNTKERRHLSFCKSENESCDLLRHCCGHLQCFWENGYKPFTEGRCEECVSEGESCQRDSKCCGNLQCNKNHVLEVNGICQKKRRYGKCYRNKQCVNGCNRKWYKLSGTCS